MGRAPRPTSTTRRGVGRHTRCSTASDHSMVDRAQDVAALAGQQIDRFFFRGEVWARILDILGPRIMSDGRVTWIWTEPGGSNAGHRLSATFPSTIHLIFRLVRISNKAWGLRSPESDPRLQWFQLESIVHPIHCLSSIALLYSVLACSIPAPCPLSILPVTCLSQPQIDPLPLHAPIHPPAPICKLSSDYLPPIPLVKRSAHMDYSRTHRRYL